LGLYGGILLNLNPREGAACADKLNSTLRSETFFISILAVQFFEQILYRPSLLQDALPSVRHLALPQRWSKHQRDTASLFRLFFRLLLSTAGAYSQPLKRDMEACL
jgi:hypothetical protein